METIIPISPKAAYQAVPPVQRQIVYHLAGANKVVLDGEKPRPILKDINLVIKEGDFVGIHGDSGAGKSTLLHLLGAIDKPTSGQMSFCEFDMMRCNGKQLAWLRREIGLVFQSFHLIANLGVYDNVALPLMLQRVLPAEIEQRVVRALFDVNFLMPEPHVAQSALLQTLVEGDVMPVPPTPLHGQLMRGARRLLTRSKFDVAAQLGLTAHQCKRLVQLPKTLSGGEKQRVAIARALVTKPQVLLADEPTGSLDRTNEDNVLDLLHTIHAQTGITIVLVSHEERVLAQCERRIRLEEGRIVEDNHFNEVTYAH